MIVQLTFPLSSQPSRLTLWKSVIVPRTVVWWTLVLSSLGWIGHPLHVMQAGNFRGWSGFGVHAFQPSPPTTRWIGRSRGQSKETRRYSVEFFCLGRHRATGSSSFVERTCDADVGPGAASAMGNYQLGHHLSLRRFRSRRMANPLFAINNSDNSEPSNGQGANLNDTGSSPWEGRNAGKKRFSMKRIGGRGRGRPVADERLSSSTSDSSNKNKWPLSGWITTLLALTLLKNLFFGGGGDSSYYYYSYSSSSSSVYETRVNPDGSRTMIETSRKESSDLKSNIPGLTSEQIRESNRNSFFINLYDEGF